jgi:DNA-binding LacI/PurR family transcriptional regulator
MRTTIKDVARQAGVSPMTASRALHRPELVAPATRARVLAACDKLHYRPNESARLLRTNKSKQVGLVIPDMRNAFWIDVIAGAEEVITQAGFELLIGNSGEEADRLTAQTNAMLSRQVAGLLVAPTVNSGPFIRSLVRAGHTLVLVDRLPEGVEGIPSVVIDNETGAYRATRHLIEAGHERIGLLAGNVNLDTGQQRLDGYSRALVESGLPIRPEWIRTARTNAAMVGKQVGYASTLELLDVPAGPTALLCTSNTIAIGALLALQERCVAIPDTMALVSFGNTEWSVLVTPALTVITQPTAELGREAGRMLLACVAGKPPVQQHLSLEPELIVRGSSIRAAETARPH